MLGVVMVCAVVASGKRLKFEVVSEKIQLNQWISDDL